MATDCDILNQVLTTESGRIGSDIQRRMLHTSAWIDLPKVEPFPEGMGSTIKVLTFERSLPANELTWTAIGQNPDVNNTGEGDPSGVTDGGTCIPPVQKIGFGQTLREFSLEQTALESPTLCLHDLRVAYNRAAQLENVRSILTENTKHVWIEKNRRDYVDACEHKVIANSTLTESSASFPLVEPTSQLTQGILDRIFLRMIRAGAGSKPMDRMNNRPVFGAYMSSETSDFLIRSSGTRDDVRWSSRSNELLAPLGIDRPYRGWFHMIDDFLPRWNFVNGAWVEVKPYRLVAATKGFKVEENPAYETAAYEDTIIWHPEVMTKTVPKAMVNAGGGASFADLNFEGTWRWVNEYDKDCNPDRVNGFFRAVFACGAKPVHPVYGWTIRHLRCQFDLGLTACAES